MSLKRFYFSLVNLDTKKAKRHVLIISVLIIIFLLIITWFLGIWNVGLFVSTDSWISGVIFTVLNALILYGQLNAIGILHKSSDNKTIRYLIIFLVFFLFVSGLGFYDIMIYINLPFLLYNYVSLATEHGILFMVSNVVMFWIIWFASFSFERDS